MIYRIVEKLMVRITPPPLYSYQEYSGGFLFINSVQVSRGLIIPDNPAASYATGLFKNGM